jgi:integrase
MVWGQCPHARQEQSVFLLLMHGQLIERHGRLRRSNFRKFWHRARAAVDLHELHFHDLRHTGNTMAAAQGATLRELMERMGHSSTRAALIYLHATRERDQRIAAGMGQLFKDATAVRQAGTKSRTSGTQRARGKERNS